MRHSWPRRVLLALAGFMLLPTRVLMAQASGPIGTRDGDTLIVIQHTVPARNQQPYERWMQQVWWAAAQKVAVKDRDFGRVISARRRFVPIPQDGQDTLTYLFLYPFEPRLTGIKREGVAATLEASGMPDADIEREMKTFEGLGVRVGGYRLVQREYR